MLTNPRPGMIAQIWYRKRPYYGWEKVSPGHGHLCFILYSGKGKPRNHLVELLNGYKMIVPAGNLRKPKGTREKSKWKANPRSK